MKKVIEILCSDTNMRLLNILFFAGTTFLPFSSAYILFIFWLLYLALSLRQITDKRQKNIYYAVLAYAIMGFAGYTVMLLGII